MRNALFGMIGLGLSACATTGASSWTTQQLTQPQAGEGAVVSDGPNTDELICERSFDEQSTCPVMGSLNDAEKQSLASFMQDNRAPSIEMQQQNEEPSAPTMMQATDDQEF